MAKGKLAYELRPVIPRHLMPEDRKVVCTLLDRVKVVYDFGNVEKVIPGAYQWKKKEACFWETLHWQSGKDL
ncbi:MAG: hypothetical protein HFI77_14500 [Lachnospiraceae bacterium]|nr:hypothetical protein [Lachnospiraceae bacterium]